MPIAPPIGRGDAPPEQIEINSAAITRRTVAAEQAFRAAPRDLYNRWSERIGRELVAKAETAIPQG